MENSQSHYHVLGRGTGRTFFKIYMCKQYTYTHTHTFLLMKLAISQVLYHYELHILNSVEEPIMKESSEAGKLWVCLSI